MNRQKNTNNHLVVMTLYREYGLCYSPLLLPKIAKFGFNIKGGAIFTAFITRIKLYEPAIIEKENRVINVVMAKISRLRKSQSKVESNEKQKTVNLSLSKLMYQTSPNKFNQIPRDSITRMSQQISKSGLKNKSQDVMTTYKQIYEFINIIIRRLKDLDDLIAIIQPTNQNVDSLLRFNTIIHQLIITARQIIQQISPKQTRKTLQIQMDSKFSTFFKIKNQKMTLCTDKATQQSENNDFSMLNDSNINNQRLETEDSQSPKKFKFLKRKSSKYLQTQLISGSNVANTTKKRSRFESASILRRTRTVPSNVPQKSFRMKDKNESDSKQDTQSKNTQEKFEQDLERQHEQELLFERKEEKKVVRSQRQFNEPKVEEKKRRISDRLSSLQDQILKMIGVQKMKKIQKQSEIIEIDHEQKNDHTKNLVKVKSLASDIVAPVPMDKQSQTKLNQQSLQTTRRPRLDSRESITTDNSHSYKKSQFNIGKNIRNVKLTKDESDDEDELLSGKKFNDHGRKKKVRGGGMQRSSSRFGDSTRTISESEQTHSKHIIEGHNKNRRTGKQLPHDMNKSFQRLLQDQNIEKMMIGSHMKQKANHLTSQKKNGSTDGIAKNTQPGRLKRIRKGTETSIVINLPSSRQLPQESRLKFGVKKEKLTDLEKERFMVNYSDLLALQKNLKPIATYNQPKMVTRYSMFGGQGDVTNFQFRFQNGKLLFNHEFYLRKEDENRSEVTEEMKAREKLMRRETMKFEFMNQFKKRLQQHDDPIQCGYDDPKEQSQKFIEGESEKIRMEMMI